MGLIVIKYGIFQMCAIMNSNQWAAIVTACQQGDTQHICDIISCPPSDIRFNKLLKIALKHQQWRVVEQLLPLWVCTKSPRIFNFAPEAPLHVVQKACEVLKNNASSSHARKDCIAAVKACAMRQNASNLKYFIEQLRKINVPSLHDAALWRAVGNNACAEIYTILIQNFKPDAALSAQVFLGAVECENWSILDCLTPQSLHRHDFLDGLVRSARLGKAGIIDHYFPHITTEDLHTVIKKSMESCFVVNRSVELNVWLNTLIDFSQLGPVIEDLLKCAIGLDNLKAVKQLAPYYTPQETEVSRLHPLDWVVNNLAGTDGPDHSLDMLHTLLPQHHPSDPLLAHTVHIAVSRRGHVTLDHLDAVRTYSTYPHIDVIAFTGAVLKTNTAAVKHLMSKISDEDFLQALSEVKKSVGHLENLPGWGLLEPIIQPRILHLALAENGSNHRAIKRKI